MQAIILAAGEGKRISNLTKGGHKSLLPINENDSFLSRLFHQINEYNFTNVVVVTGHKDQLISELVNTYQFKSKVIFNKLYKKDVNIFSMKLALENIDENKPVIIFEADMYFTDIAFNKVYSQASNNVSVWFSRGPFLKTQYGGIVSADSNKNIDDIKIVSSYSIKYKNYKKISGVMIIGTNQIKKYKELVLNYANKSINQYYLIPWIDNINILKSVCFNLSYDEVFSFNKESEYRNFLKSRAKKNITDFELIEIKNIFPIEHYIVERKDILKKKILQEKFWTKPIIIDKNNNLLMDGHHRFQVAKELSFKKLPAVKIDYNTIEIWSLRNNEKVSKEIVKERALSNNIFPNKTVKHAFDFQVVDCKIPINELK